MASSGPRPPPALGSANSGGLSITGSEYQFARPSPNPLVSPHWNPISTHQAPSLPSYCIVPTTSSFQHPITPVVSTTPPSLEELRSYQQQMMANLQQHMDEIRLLTSSQSLPPNKLINPITRYIVIVISNCGSQCKVFLREN